MALKQESLRREEILPGVWFSHVRTDKHKTAVLSIAFLSQLARETASLNALIPYVLLRGTTAHPDMEKLNGRMDELYGADVSPFVRLIGEVQCTGLVTSFPEARYLPESKGYTAEIVALAAELILSPLTRGGLLTKDYVDSEKAKMAENIRSRINEKRSYAAFRCTEEMCCYEDYAVGSSGSAEDCEAVNYKKLTKQYHNMLQSCPVEIIYVGSESYAAMAGYLKDALMTMPRGDIDWDMGTDIRMNSVEEEARYCEEHLDVTQGKLVIGFRLGEWMEDPDLAALSVFNSLYGGSITSKLFMNVRERMQLCYYASSNVNIHKGIMFAQAGIDFDSFEKTRDEILAQLDAVRRGEVSGDELSWAKAAVKSDLKAIPDSVGALESYWFGKIMSGLTITPEEYSAMVDDVTLDDITELARSIVPDMIYFLRNDPDAAPGEEETAEDEGAEDEGAEEEAAEE